ncbi:Oleoyl phosphatidylcholine desaturase [Mycena chlorophos]|uniref:Oleoyl phosphatidylcholine desaturase n=1 Tax=Mycena chlorophos TaxID=658473 RepID=A0A8H6S354_MYCCL|nr:Oleoyl phosphatidylcholine desaturase [Mycena chlorophos]
MASPKTHEQGVYVVPDVTIKQLLNAIPTHCFKRSALRSSLHMLYNMAVVLACYKAATFLDAFINPESLTFPHPALYPLARFALWSLYGFWAGLFATGLWVVAHEAGHQAFSESKTINNSVGWILHSALGVPYHSWRVSHAKHHASTAHMTQDQVFVPRTRSEMSLPPLDTKRDDALGANVSAEVQKELWEALGDSPLGAVFGFMSYLIIGWPLYLCINASGQARYPKWVTNHFNPNSAIFSAHHFGQVLVSDVGVFLWIAGLVAATRTWGFGTVFVVYGVPYLWVNHWLICITFLQHTDPILPHYRAAEFTFPRGALSTLDRNLMGDLGPVMGWIGAHATLGISETHVLHHICSKIPHYNAWEASAAVRKLLEPTGIPLDGAPGGWSEMYRVFKECKFVEDEGDVIFYKNARGLAAMRPVFIDTTASDSGIEIDKY